MSELTRHAKIVFEINKEVEVSADNNTRRTNTAIFIVIFLVVVVAALIVVLLNYGGESKTSQKYKSLDQEALVCEAGPLEDAFFSVKSASQVKHEVKAILVEGKISKMFYMYDGKLKNEDEAERASTSMHIKYDTYLADSNDKNSGKLGTTFSHPDTDLRIDIFADAKDINSATAVFFFLDKEKLNDIIIMEVGDLKNYYEKIGFGCKYE